MTIFNNIKNLLDEKGIPVMEFENKIGLQRGGFYKWKHHEPGISKIKAAADYLDVSIESLLKEQEG